MDEGSLETFAPKFRDGMTTSYKQLVMDDDTDAMLRVISAVRAQPAVVREVVHVAAAEPAGVATATAPANVAVVAESVAAAASERVPAAASEPAAVAAGESARGDAAGEPRVEDAPQHLPMIGGDTKPLRIWPPEPPKPRKGSR